MEVLLRISGFVPLRNQGFRHAQSGEPQGPGAGSGRLPTTANAESWRSACPAPQRGQDGSALSARDRRVSKRSPHDAHRYSKIGMARFLLAAAM